jgi:hypothetical protein
MKKKTLIAKLFAFALGSMLAFSACSFLPEKEPVEEVEEEEEEEELQEIELSDKKVTIEIGETVEVEIDNFDDLKKVKIEVDDEDIAEAELDDETITITGLAEGKTTLIVSAKEAEDVKLTIKVTAPEIVVPETTIETGKYVCTYAIPNAIWDETMGEDAELFIDFLANKSFTLDFIMIINEDGTATLSYGYETFVKDLLDYLDENYIEFMKLACEYAGEEWDDSFEEMCLEVKDEMMEQFEDELESEIESADATSIDLTWEIRDGKIYFKPDRGAEIGCEVRDDGSFIISISADELDTDMFGNYLDLHFAKA